MTVYVGSMQAKFGRMTMCHMIADTTAELTAMADAIGVQRKWIQYPGTPKEHFDIALSKRTLAVVNGAIEITWKQCGCTCTHRQITGQLCAPEDAEAWAEAFFAAKIIEKGREPQ